MASSRNDFTWLGWALAASGVTALWWYKVVLVRRPFWLYTTDLEHTYLFNSLLLVRGEPPVSWFHPGTPAVGLGAVLASALHAGVGELYQLLSWGYVLTLLATLGAMALLVRAFVPPRATALTTAAITLTLFVHPSAPLFLTYWGSYSLVIPVGVVAVWGVWRALTAEPRWAAAATAWAGVWAGLACALLMLFLPVVIGGITALITSAWVSPREPGWRQSREAQRARWAWISLGVLLAAVGVALGLSVASDGAWGRVRWKAALALGVSGAAMLGTTGWLRPPHERPLRAVSKLLTYVLGFAAGWAAGTLGFPQATQFSVVHLWYSLSGTHFHGAATLPPDVIAANTAVLLTRSAWWSMLLVGVCALLIRRFRMARVNPADRSFALALALMILIGTAVGLKEGTFTSDPLQMATSIRYLLPVAPVVAIALAWLVREERRWRWPASLTALLLGAFLTVSGQDIAAHRRFIAWGQDQNAHLDAKLAEVTQRIGRHPKVLMDTIAYRPSSNYHVANRQYGKNIFSPELDAMFPNEGSVDLMHSGPIAPSDPRLRGFDALLVSEERITPELRPMLERLGRVERWSDGLEPPVVVVWLARTDIKG